ncbi:hypothetical protein [Deinococcus alpinitundrae]|uniref:hypothetical protein n=1 Tax=Deinococcus alpinitundrae TaxID=468913 RepID=UPI00137B4BFF|nr:hypothetical protein [Deinococcus alpinitundrae]
MIKLTALTLGGLGLVLASLAALPPGVCRAEVRPINRAAPLNQLLISVSVPLDCPLTSKAVLRFRTAQDGVLPIIGYFVLRGSYPRERRLWLTAKTDEGGVPRVEQKFEGQWNTIWRAGQ